MLSILIPTFNYNVAPLVSELYNQCMRIENLEFEIHVNDDASKQTFENDLIEYKTYDSIREDYEYSVKNKDDFDISI